MENEIASLCGALQLDDNVLRIVVVGEQECGKTTFINEFYNCAKNPKERNLDHDVKFYRFHFEIDERDREFEVFELPSDEDFSYKSELHQYEEAFIVIFMFAIDDPRSFEKITSRWIPEISASIEKMKRIPFFVLLGNKFDLRNDEEVIHRLAQENQYVVTPQQMDDFLFPEFWDTLSIDVSSLDNYEVYDVWVSIIHEALNLVVVCDPEIYETYIV